MTHADHKAKSLGQALSVALESLASSAVFCRYPLVDPHAPQTCDLDLLAFADVPDVLPERRWVGPGLIPVDIIWLPQELLSAPKSMAVFGVMAQRLVTSRPVTGEGGQGFIEAVETAMVEPTLHAQRIQGFLDMAGATICEIGANWDFPGICRFWMQIALSSCITAFCDAHRQWAPNAYTRPYDALTLLEHSDATRWRQALSEILDLQHVDALSLIPPLRRIHAQVTELGVPDWPVGYRLDTQFEMGYYSSYKELEWRISVLEEMNALGLGSQAVVYLRFWAYSLARIPMVHARVREGISISYGRPWTAMQTDLAKHCPEILADLALILGGASLGRPQILARIRQIHSLRDGLIEGCKAKGIPLADALPWVPKPHRHRPNAAL